MSVPKKKVVQKPEYKYRIIGLCKWCDDEYPEAAGIDYIGNDFEKYKEQFFRGLAQIAEGDEDCPEDQVPKCRCEDSYECKEYYWTYDVAFDHYIKKEHYFGHPLIFY